MDKKVCVRVDNGLDVLMRVVGVLKRKRFQVKGVNMENLEDANFANLTIILEENMELTAEKCINQMKKLVNVYDAREA
ncbi:ACT domain-containing protein [Clostridiisalibacter paucivorans]|uniref:ACT domain-containing protein n=1 Tax=Clostridiisalibacter paucivorans TaxID=408753 RepID=UPI00047DE9FA|nr:ACT domain-containing protein [Clostridiisalibacter paucivorans]